MHPTKNNIGAYLDNDIAGGKHLIVAGSGTDNVKVDGQTIDRLKFDSLVLSVAYIASLAATKTLSIAIEEQQSADNSNWDVATVVLASTVVLTGASGGSVGSVGVTNTNINLASKKRYVRYNITADLNNSGTDTASWVATAIKGGAYVHPTT